MTEIKLPKSRNRLWIAVDPDGEPLWYTMRALKGDVIWLFKYGSFSAGRNWEAFRKAGWTIQKVRLEKGWSK